MNGNQEGFTMKEAKKEAISSQHEAAALALQTKAAELERARPLSAAQKDRYRLTFDFFDADASGKLDKRIKTLETVLFKTSEQERSRLFDHIYEKIANSRKESENDDKKLQSAIDLHTKKLASFELKIEASDRKTADVQELCQQVTRDYAKTNENVQEWYNEFMTKVTNQHK